MKGVKAVLGVRHSTMNDLCLIESGFPPLKSLVYDAQARFFRKMTNRLEMEDDPLGFILRLVEREDPRMWATIQKIISVDSHVKDEMDKMKESALGDHRSRNITYLKMNPHLNIHNLYMQSTIYIPDSLRIVFTRLRLSSHCLRIEVGRWSRIPRENRLCSCGLLQDEEHVMLCVSNQQVLQKYDYKECQLGLLHLFTKLDVKHLAMLSELVENIQK